MEKTEAEPQNKAETEAHDVGRETKKYRKDKVKEMTTEQIYNELQKLAEKFDYVDRVYVERIKKPGVEAIVVMMKNDRDIHFEVSEIEEFWKVRTPVTYIRTEHAEVTFFDDAGVEIEIGTNLRV